ncbi:restriction endonuclease subunit S [Leptospira stimsonii]|uniref:Type I restriction endonuclease subunit S n=1 Tax=Leptospira stimsonii TaxID=2202203 RepID=A0A396YV47_9LEPT|nr:restriction endonuclease subunit S [Leptospira stimsonii]RHX87112.1 type I restriction endonuclease subunit S [Leptospira stimsonii]
MREVKRVALTDVCDFQGGTQPPKEEWLNFPEIGYVRMLQIRDFTQGKLEYIEYVKDNEKLKKCEENDVLIGRYGASVGKILRGLAGAYNVALIKTIPDEDVLFKGFLYRLLRDSSFQNFIQAIGARAAQAGFNKDDLSSFSFSLPPLSKQIQIAEILTQAETLIAQRKESIRLLDELVKSQFLEMFGDPVKNEKGWEVNELEKLVANDCPLTYGIVQPGEEFSNGVPIIRPVDLTELVVKKDRLKRIDPAISNQFKRTILNGNEILMCVRGTTGTVSFASSELKGCNVTRGITPIWFSEDYNTLFAYALLLSHSFNCEIQKLTYGATLQQINLSDLRKMKLINPPLVLQNQFANFFEGIQSQMNFHNLSLRELETLYSSLSQKAFRGELTFAKETIAINDYRVSESNAIKESLSHPKKQSKDNSKTSNVIELKPTNVDFYKRTVLAAEIVWQLHKEPTFGHLKLQKLLYLCIRTSNMQLPVNFSQQAMGPYDPRLMRSIDKQLQEKKWFQYNKENSLKYEALANAGQHEVDFQKYYSSEQARIFSLIKKFKTTKSDTVEIVATLYACLENIVEQGEAFSEALMMKMFYDWSDRKKDFDELEVRRVFQKMKDSRILPKGILSSIF